MTPHKAILKSLKSARRQLGIHLSSPATNTQEMIAKINKTKTLRDIIKRCEEDLQRLNEAGQGWQSELHDASAQHKFRKFDEQLHYSFTDEEHKTKGTKLPNAEYTLEHAVWKPRRDAMRTRASNYEPKQKPKDEGRK